MPSEAIPATVETMLRGYLASREPGETFADFTNRHEIAPLRALLGLPAQAHPLEG